MYRLYIDTLKNYVLLQLQGRSNILFQEDEASDFDDILIQ
jgi:hypothetical protein